MVPVERIELPTFGLQNRCSTAELNRQSLKQFGWPNLHPAVRSALEYQTCPQRARTLVEVRAGVLVLAGADDPLAPPKQVTAFENEMRAGEVGIAGR